MIIEWAGPKSSDDYVLAPTATLGRGPTGDRVGDLEEAEALAVDVCIAVTDGAGHLLAMARMDRAPLLCVQIAQDKAYSVASFGGLPTSDWWRMLESEPALLHGIVKTDRLTVFGGGVPLVADGRTVGCHRGFRGIERAGCPYRRGRGRGAIGQ